ncbi:hypothetical protein FPOAC1_003071 [Fusarium poae]|uniref:hypothetical protein n=1 Tax=Fusarium poae TaxID=36050 RepID=UPI001CE9F7CA|nr:hypothetical protein FPOAC1_003071 [Fusarium poae]KAG8677060.1 hypothetical protein FPOAC1_003071 [Fusarium poae]
MNTLTTNGLPIVSHNDEQRVFGGGWVAFQMQMQIGSVPMGGTAARAPCFDEGFSLHGQFFAFNPGENGHAVQLDVV